MSPLKTYQDLGGKSVKHRLKGLETCVLMYENDQLNGIFFLQRIRDKKLRSRLFKI